MLPVFFELTDNVLSRVRKPRACDSSYHVLLIVCCIWIVTGCTTKGLVTTISSAESNGISNGIPYYLPRPRINLTLATLDKQAPVWTVGINEYTSDTRIPLLLTYKPSGTADEEMCVERDAAGMLKTILFDSADRTGDILVKIAETAATIAQRGPQLRDVEAPTRTVVFDPCSEEEKKRAISIFGEIGSPVELDILGLACPISGAPKETGPATAANVADQKAVSFQDIQQQCALGSVCFVTLTRLPLIAKSNGISQGLTVEYVDYKGVGRLDIERVALTRATTRLGFSNGALTEVGFNRPSQSLEVARLPLRIINAVLNVPASFFAKIAQGFRSEADANLAAAQLVNAQALLAQTSAKPSPVTTASTPAMTGTPSDIGVVATAPAVFTSAFQCIGKKSSAWLG